MYKVKTGLGVMSDLDLSVKEQIALFKKAGFDAFFTGYDASVSEYKQYADEIGMIYQSVHAPFGGIDTMWRGNPDKILNTLLDCARACGQSGVPIMIVHTYIGFEENPGPCENGIENFRKVVELARECGVKVAFENTEGEEYLAALMEAFKGYDNVGFCWDTGHELCYNRSKDLTALYGDRLIATHLNDNLGISDYNGKTFWTDDLHLLPFDGVNDWESVAKRLCKCGFDDILTFELTRTSKPGRHENDKYKKLSAEEYVAEVYARACRLATLKIKYSEK